MAAYTRDQIVYFYRGDTLSAVQCQVVGINTIERKDPGWVTEYTYTIEFYDSTGAVSQIQEFPEGLLFANTTDYNAYQSGVYNWDTTTVSYP